MLALAYVMNFSGQTITIGTWIAATGALFAYLGPHPGGGSQHRRHRLGHQRERPVRHAPAERRRDRRHRPDPAGWPPAPPAESSSKMISPQNLTIRAAGGLVGRESDILRRSCHGASA